MFRDLLRRTFPFRALRGYRSRRQLRQWESRGRTPPTPHVVKQRIVRSFAQQSGIRTLVESGTYMGDMVEAVARDFDAIYSIELDASLCNLARRRLARYAHVSIIQGDSAKVLPQVLVELRQKTIFWLDGHYSGGRTARGHVETPVLQELDHVLAHEVGGHVVLLDDARCFDGTNDYPTREHVISMARSRWPDCSIELVDDVICICNQTALTRGVRDSAEMARAKGSERLPTCEW